MPDRPCIACGTIHGISEPHGVKKAKKSTPVAQVVEPSAHNGLVASSNLVGGTNSTGKAMTPAERQAKRREKDKDAYNEYMREYQRKRRLRLKERDK